MAIDIKRVRFFDGQFLKEGDFQAEQRYHSHLRRRMNYLLFGQSGVVPMTPDDLTLEVVSAVDKTFRVKAGMAIGQNVLEEEGREILLSAPSAPIDLDTAGIVAGQTAVVTLHFEEEVTDLSTEGEVSQETRFKEKAVITVGLAKPATPASGDPYVQLGTIAYNTMTIAATGREVALLRSSLIAAAPVPTITGVTGTTSASSGSVIMTILGNNLSLATLVTFSDPLVTAVLGANAPGSQVVTVTIAPGATPGPKSFQISTPSGIGFSPAGVVFTVLSPVPVVTGVVGTPTVVVGGPPTTMIITGNNLTGASAVAFIPAVGLTVVPGSIVPTASTVTLQVQAGLGATSGLKSFQVTTPGGVASSPGGVGLQVLLSPTISGVSGTTTIVANNVAAPGFVINGTNLTGATVSFPTEPTMVVGVPAVNGAGTTATLTVTAPLGMTPGPKQFRVTTPAGFVDSGVAIFLTVNAPVAAPTITSIDVHNFPRLTDTNAIITGTFLTGGTVTVSGTGVTVTPNGVPTATTIPITVHVTNSATTGSRTFTVTTAGGSVPSSGAPVQLFTVTL